MAAATMQGCWFQESLGLTGITNDFVCLIGQRALLM
jgi:hypothetical protein